ncbi:MAG: hypothetical protein ACOX25_01285 [Caldicoprobacterales bacterium]
MERFVKPGMRVLLKMQSAHAEKARRGSDNPSPKWWLLQRGLVKEAGGHPIIAGQPGRAFYGKSAAGSIPCLVVWRK